MLRAEIKCNHTEKEMSEEFIIPYSLLEVAGLSDAEELEISYQDGAIIIERAEPDPLTSVPIELMNLFADLGISDATVRSVLMKGEI